MGHRVGSEVLIARMSTIRYYIGQRAPHGGLRWTLCQRVRAANGYYLLLSDPRQGPLQSVSTRWHGLRMSALRSRHSHDQFQP